MRRRELIAIQIGGRGQWRVEVDELERFIQQKYAEARAGAVPAPGELTSEGAGPDDSGPDGGGPDESGADDGSTAGRPGEEPATAAASGRSPGRGRRR